MRRVPTMLSTPADPSSPPARRPGTLGLSQHMLHDLLATCPCIAPRFSCWYIKGTERVYQRWPATFSAER